METFKRKTQIQPGPAVDLLLEPDWIHQIRLVNPIASVTLPHSRSILLWARGISVHGAINFVT